MYVHVYILQFLKRNFVVEIVKGLLIHFLWDEGTTFTSHKKGFRMLQKVMVQVKNFKKYKSWDALSPALY